MIPVLAVLVEILEALVAMSVSLLDILVALVDILEVLVAMPVSLLDLLVVTIVTKSDMCIVFSAISPAWADVIPVLAVLAVIALA